VHLDFEQIAAKHNAYLSKVTAQCNTLQTSKLKKQKSQFADI